jgi:serine/threonine-protein kinase
MKLNPRKLCTVAFVGIYLLGVILLTDRVIMPLVVSMTGDVRVPDVVGMAEAEALSTLKKSGLDHVIMHRFEPKSFDRTVLYQSPEEGATVKSGRIVRLVISENELMVSVPRLKLTTLRDARVTLEAAGLKVGQITEQPTGEFPPGIVLTQSIEEHTKVRSGTMVDLIVSVELPRTVVAVPMLIGLTLSKAKESIVEAGLKIGKVKKIHRPDLLPGTVVGQEPDTSASVLPDYIVNLTVSSLESQD